MLLQQHLQPAATTLTLPAQSPAYEKGYHAVLQADKAGRWAGLEGNLMSSSRCRLSLRRGGAETHELDFCAFCNTVKPHETDDDCCQLEDMSYYDV